MLNCEIQNASVFSYVLKLVSDGRGRGSLSSNQSTRLIRGRSLCEDQNQRDERPSLEINDAFNIQSGCIYDMKSLVLAIS